MKTSVQLHQFAEVRFALPPLTMFLPLSTSAPQPFRHHPAAQGLVVDLQAVFLGQVFGCQCRPKSLLLRTGILPLDQSQYLPSKLCWLLRCEARPALPCCRPPLPSFRTVATTA